MMVNFMCQFGPRDAQITGKTLFLGVSVRVFLEEISIWIGRRSKDHPHQLRWYQPIHRPQDRTKWKWSKFALFMLKLEHPSSPALRYQHSWFLDLQTQNEPHHQLSWLFSLRMADSGTSWPPLLYEPIPIISLSFYIGILLVLFL